jgi:hypothetical protein
MESDDCEESPREYRVSQSEKMIHLMEAQLLIFTQVYHRIHQMSQQFDTVNAAVQAVATSNAALVSLTNSIFTALQAALAGGNGMTAAEVQTLVDSITAVKTADDATVAADTVSAPVPSPAPSPAPAPAPAPSGPSA